MERSTLGQLIRQAREAQGLTGTQLAPRLAIIAGQDVDTLVAAAERQRSRLYPGWQRRHADLTAKVTKAKQRQDAINEARLDNRMTRDEANRRYRLLDAEIMQAEQELAAGPKPVDPEQIQRLSFGARQLLSADVGKLATTAPKELQLFLKQIGARVIFRDGAPILEGL